ncbi:MAG: hypothetical protein FWD89_00395 [Firmicutes bacterium]|nr:hypothetical protein [Bacillota bacterium]
MIVPCKKDFFNFTDKQFDMEKIKENIRRSRRRAKDNFYGYGLANDWDYFLTLTFSDELIDRYDDEAVKYVWKLFRQKLQRINKDVKLLAIPERHKKKNEEGKKALHLHILVGSIDLTEYMERATDYHTGEEMSSNGAEVYNLPLFDFGFSTIIHFPKTEAHKFINYCLKYLTKQLYEPCILDNYNKRYYYRTLNLNKKEKVILYMEDEDFDDIIFSNMRLDSDTKVSLVKDKEHIKVVRIKKD